MRRSLFLGGLIVLALVAASPSGRQEDAASLGGRARAALAPIAGELEIGGLQKPVEVIRDTWGVPHIYAQTTDDLFFAQGFVAAQDRLWQLDLWRRVAEGRVAEVAGPSAIDRDTFARLLRYRGDMDAEWRSYAPDARRIAEAFVRGVNAQIAYVAAHPEKLPIEFQITRTRPEPWTPEVVISRMAGYVMTRNARTEVARARLAQRVGIGRVADFIRPDPPVPIALPEGLDLADITDDILALTEGAGGAISFRSSSASIPSIFSIPSILSIGNQRSAISNSSEVGSNNWVVAGRLSATGRPLLANDPHRTIALPSLRYSVHLNGPGWHVVGAGEPALPGVAAGHNEHVAFGFTIVGIDQQDLYVERLNPSRPDQYLYKGAWEPMRVEREAIAVKGEAPRQVELRFTRHGPVIHVDRERQRAYALRWVGMEPGTAGYLDSLSLNIARNWPEFLKALEGWKVPSENLVYADREGNIGWVAAGLAPVRPNWNGLLPVPGHEGRYEWSGFLPVSELPQAFNPPGGFIATANHNILPPDYPKMLGYEWSAPHRFNRIDEVLSARRAQIEAGGRAEDKLTIAESELLQHDALSVVARAIVRALRGAMETRPIADPRRRAAALMLAEWDGTLDRTSAPAALYELWLPRLQRAVGLATRPAEERAIAGDRLSVDDLLAALARGGEAVAGALVGPALDEAVAEAEKRMGPDRLAWAWGRIHRARFEHALATTPARREVFNLPDVPRGGDSTTPFATGGGEWQTSGASFREVIDVADWDRSTTINVPGQSGQPGSPFYGNLLPLWAEGRYHPMLFSRAAVEKHAAHKLVLTPARRD
jgi:penicillin amidase